MKRILIFSVAYHPFVGGAEVAVKEITDRINDREFEMITLNLDGNQKPIEKIGNVLVYRIGRPGKLSKLFFPFSAFRFAKKLHKKNPYDAIWSIMASFSGFAASFFKKRYPKIPFILTLQEGDPISHIRRRVGLLYPIFKKIFRRADKIQVISNYLGEWARSMGATCPISVVPNGVDIALFSRPENRSEIDSMKIRLDKKDDEIILITTSRLVEKNDVASIIKSLEFLPKNISLFILGTGKLEMDLRNLAIESDLSDRVNFLGQVDYKDIPPYLFVSDIFVRPSLSEGMGNSFIEAMSAGVPVIATPVGGIPDFLADQKTGLFCEVSNPKSIAEKVSLLINNKVLRDEIVSNARKMVIEKYDWNLIAKKMENLL